MHTDAFLFLLFQTGPLYSILIQETWPSLASPKSTDKMLDGFVSRTTAGIEALLVIVFIEPRLGLVMTHESMLVSEKHIFLVVGVR